MRDVANGFGEPEVIGTGGDASPRAPNEEDEKCEGGNGDGSEGKIIEESLYVSLHF